MLKKNTIAAISTAMSPSGIGIVRISGPDSFSIIRKIAKKKNGNDLFESEIESHTVTHGYIVDSDIAVQENLKNEKGFSVIDEVLIIAMRGPKTYTGEDTIEINCHGGVYVVQRVLETVIKYGATIAEPGEFTKRAFLNGKMDLSRAESVIDLINSTNEFAKDNALKQLKGVIYDEIQALRAEIIHEIAFIETALDDPEHISLEGYPLKLYELVAKLTKRMENILEKSGDGQLLVEGIQTVIVGKPNAGKSSLWNALLGQDRAIVTDIAGTTRDVLSERISLSGITLNMIDTAGIRDTEDVVEKIGVNKSKEYVEIADLIMYLVDGSTSLDENDKEILELIKDKKAIVLLNKTDLEIVVDKKELQQLSGRPIFEISAKNQTGLDEVTAEIKNLFFSGKISFRDDVCITNMRQKEAMMSACESLKLVMNSIDSGLPEDFFSIDLMNAYEALGSITGETIGDDLVNEIFSKFCMGK